MHSPHVGRLFLAVFTSLCTWTVADAAPNAPLYDWDFTPAHVTLRSPQTVAGFVTVRNLPNSPVNLLGSQWYALDMYPGAAADGPFRITGLFSDGFAGLNLAPGQSATVRVLSFAPRGPLTPGYSGEIIGGAHMRFLGPSGEFLDVGGLDKKLRVSVVPEPTSVFAGALAALAVLLANRPPNREKGSWFTGRLAKDRRRMPQMMRRPATTSSLLPE